MTPIALTILIFGIMLACMAVRVPIAISMFAAGSIGYVLQTGWLPFAYFLNTQAFARFAPSEVVEAIIAQGISTRSETKEVTVLFADLKGFTPLAENLDPAQLVALLNGYFAAMGEVIAAPRGHLAKFIGDGLLALFGALEPNPWQTNDAVHAALAMRAALASYNEALRAEGRPVLAAGIGIHRGPVVAGVVGNAALMEYGVIGRTVNVASRVEGLTLSK